MSEPSHDRADRPLGDPATDPGWFDERFDSGRAVLSAQAILLHATGLAAVLRSGAGSILGIGEAERLAEECGAVVEELVDAGFWIATDVSYVIRSGSFGAFPRVAAGDS